MVEPLYVRIAVRVLTACQYIGWPSIIMLAITDYEARMALLTYIALSITPGFKRLFRERLSNNKEV